MDVAWQQRLCDLVTGAAGAATLAGVVTAHWRGALLCAVGVVIAQLLRTEV